MPALATTLRTAQPVLAASHTSISADSTLVLANILPTPGYSTLGGKDVNSIAAPLSITYLFFFQT